MIRVQYFANSAGDVAVTVSDISTMFTGHTPNFFLPFWTFGGIIESKQLLIFKVSLF